MLPVLRHERVELLLRVRAAAVVLEQLVEVPHHVRDGGAVVVRGVLERLLHAGEALVEDLAAEQVLDLLVLLSGGRTRPVVAAQFLHGARGRRRQAVELQLGQRAVTVVHVDVPGEFPALGAQGLVEQLLHLLQGAVEVVPAREFASAFGHTAHQVVEAPLRLPATAQELAEGALGRGPAHDVLADGVERLGQVDRGSERVRPALVPAVAGVAAQAAVLPTSHRRPRRPPTPC